MKQIQFISILLGLMLSQSIWAQLKCSHDSILIEKTLSASISSLIEVVDGVSIECLTFSNGAFYNRLNSLKPFTGEVKFLLQSKDSEASSSIAEIEGFFMNGKKEGSWRLSRFFERKGEISANYVLLEENYKDGLLHGARRIIDKNGFVATYSTIFIEGTGVFCEYYADTKQLIFVGYMTNGKRDGCWEYYSRDGNCIRKENYKNGVLHGKFEVYNNIGDRIYQTDFMNGTGFYKAYNEYGEITAEGKMENNFCVGSWKRYKYLANSGNDSRNRITRWYEYGKDSTNSLEELDERTIATYYIDDIPFYIRVSKK